MRLRSCTKGASDVICPRTGPGQKPQPEMPRGLAETWVWGPAGRRTPGAAGPGGLETLTHRRALARGPHRGHPCWERRLWPRAGGERLRWGSDGQRSAGSGRTEGDSGAWGSAHPWAARSGRRAPGIAAGGWRARRPRGPSLSGVTRGRVLKIWWMQTGCPLCPRADGRAAGRGPSPCRPCPPQGCSSIIQ